MEESIMKSMLKISCLSAACIAALALVSCQKETTPAPAPAPEQPSAKTYTLTVDATKGEDTKALSLDGQVLNVKWADTDQVSVFAGDWSGDPMGTLTAAASETGSTTLTGAVTGANKGDNLNFLFPRAEWSYTGQKGILLSDENSIEKKYDYAAATVTVNEVDGTTITTDAANFTSQQAIVKFRLTDGTDPIAVNSLKIEASSNKLVANKGYRGCGTKTYYYGDSYYTVDGGSGGFGGEEHGKLVDNNLSTKWCANKPSGNWYIEFHTASAIQVDGYMLRTGGDTWPETGRNPQSWVLYGKKNSGDSWSIIDTKTDNYDMPDASNAEQDFDADAPGQYKYFRLEISAVRSGICMQMSEMRLFSYEYFGLGTTYGSITVKPDDAASELTVALRNENASADTYTLTATVGSGTYTFSKSGITFENGKYYDIRVPMNAKKLSYINLNKTSANLLIGGTVTLSVSYSSPSDAVDKTVSWSSSNTSVATVNSSTGEVTAVAGGSATITATANDGGGATATCSITVYPEGAIVWDESNWGSEEHSYQQGDPYTNSNITLTMNGNAVFGISYWGNATIVCSSYGAKGNFVFSNSLSKKFTKIEIDPGDDGFSWKYATLGTGWTVSGDYMTGYKVTWTGNASTVSLFDSDDWLDQSRVNSIMFILE
jgi:hypothetical protein